jgi:hypothetical protein
MGAEYPGPEQEHITPIKDMIVRYGRSLKPRGDGENTELTIVMASSDLMDLLTTVAPALGDEEKLAMIRRALYGAKSSNPGGQFDRKYLYVAPLALMHENPQVDIMSELGDEYFSAALALAMQSSIIHQQCVGGGRHCVRGVSGDETCPTKKVLAMATNIIDPVLEYTYLCEKDDDSEALERCDQVTRNWRRAMTKTWTGGMLAPMEITAILDSMSERAKERVDEFVVGLDIE